MASRGKNVKHVGLETFCRSTPVPNTLDRPLLTYIDPVLQYSFYALDLHKVCAISTMRMLAY